MTTPAALLSALRLPVVAAPMFLVSGPDLVVAACTSGIVGSFPASNCREPGELAEWLEVIRGRLVDAEKASARPVAPWAMNLITHSSNTRLGPTLELVAEYRPPVVITALGSPAPVMDTVKSYGGLVVADVVNLDLARKAARYGVDGLACVSAGSGGHTGHLSPFAFASSVRGFFDGLVVVGGGIAGGYGVAGAVACGADLTYVGTRFLASTESLAPQPYKDMIVEHESSDLVVSAAITGTDASWLRPSLRANGLDPDAPAPVPERDYSGTRTRRWKDVWSAGQGIGDITSVESTAVIVDRIESEYREAAHRFTERTHGYVVR